MLKYVYMFLAEKITPTATVGRQGWRGGVEEIIRPRRVWGRLLVRDLLSMGKMIPAAAAGGPNGITDEYCSYNLSRRSLFVLILTISMDVFFFANVSLFLAVSVFLPPSNSFPSALLSLRRERNPITIITTVTTRHSDIKAKTYSLCRSAAVA